MDAELGLRTVWFGLAGFLLYLPLFRYLPSDRFRASRRAVVMGASLFWLGFTAVLLHLAWVYYYGLFYPQWIRWGGALIAAALYSIYALACHWCSCRLPGRPMLWFCLFTGFLACGEHYIAWTLAHLPEKVPLLAGMPLPAAMLFAFFEYQVYWALAMWLAWILLQISRFRHGIESASFSSRLHRSTGPEGKAFHVNERSK